jgi:hypothetical protein
LLVVVVVVVVAVVVVVVVVVVVSNSSNISIREHEADPELTYCIWMNRNRKPLNKEKIFYFIHVWLLIELSVKVRLPNLIYLATPGLY